MESGLEADKYSAKLGVGAGDDIQSSDANRAVELTTGRSDDGQENANEDTPENNPSTRHTVLATVDLHPHFHELRAGVIEEYVHTQQDKGFGFARYNNHVEVDRAIQLGNTRILVNQNKKGFKHFPIE
uniref:Oligouridylate binding protein n=1 Tax=Solanum tuberosum TaxID=4113 RepID=M1DMS6_SOLTU